jgi:hypothetical protein
MSRIDDIRKSVSIASAWYYLDLPGKPGRTCMSPFREDRKPSFSVYKGQDGIEKWLDHGTSERGDVVDLWAKAKGSSIEQALTEIESIYRLGLFKPAASVSVYTTVEDAPEKLEKVVIHGLREPTPMECHHLGELRGLWPESFFLAGRMGTLKIGPYPGAGGKEDLWWITDERGIAAEGRTFTGKDCQTSGKKCAAFPGSKKDWPIGLLTTNSAYDDLKKIVLVEGGPDYFAGLQLAIECNVNFRVAALLGAGVNLGEEALTNLQGSEILIIPHSDPEGWKAANRWSEQLKKFAKSIKVQRLPEGQDLNDFLKTANNHETCQLLKGL